MRGSKILVGLWQLTMDGRSVIQLVSSKKPSLKRTIQNLAIESHNFLGGSMGTWDQWWGHRYTLMGIKHWYHASVKQSVSSEIIHFQNGLLPSIWTFLLLMDFGKTGSELLKILFKSNHSSQQLAVIIKVLTIEVIAIWRK